MQAELYACEPEELLDLMGVAQGASAIDIGCGALGAPRVGIVETVDDHEYSHSQIIDREARRSHLVALPPRR